MKKIVFFIHNYSNGGVTRRMVNLSGELSKMGYSVEMLSLHVEENLKIQLPQNVKLAARDKKSRRIEYITVNCGDSCDNEDIIEKPKTNTQNKSKGIKKKLKNSITSIVIFLLSLDKKRRIFNGVVFMRNKKKYRGYFADANADVVICIGERLVKYAYKASKGLNCRLFDAERSAHVIENKETGRFIHRINKKYMKKADGIIVQTHSEMEAFKKEYKNVYVINNPLTPNLPLPGDIKRKKEIVNFCRYSPQKNLELLIDAFNMFHKDFPDYTLRIFGDACLDGEPEYKESLYEKVKGLGLNDSVLLMPSVSKIHNTVIDSAMFVSSSDFEGLSNSMLEAMAIGLPCICTDCMGGGTREVMTDRENGLIVPMNDADAMYRAMKEFAENPALAEKCSQNVIKIREKLSVEKITRQWLEVIEK